MPTMIRAYINIYFVLTCVFLLGSSVTIKAQEIGKPRAYETANVGIVYDREMSFPITLNSNGFSAGINFGKLKTYYKTSYWGLELGYLRNPREHTLSRRGSAFGNGNSSYIYGKQNSLYPLRIHKGWKFYHSGKGKKKGVAIASIYEIGATAGITKGYLLQVGLSNDINKQRQFIAYEDYPEVFLNQSRIEGNGGFKRGWNKAKVYPGLNAKVGLHLDWGAFEEYMKALEVGLKVDVFGTKVPILTPPAQNTQVFLNFYLALHFGYRR